MRTHIIAASLLIAGPWGGMAFGQVPQSQQPVVSTANGAVRGVTHDGITSFKGIPYAAPPVGEYRWRAPQPVTPWTGEHDANEFGPSCPQISWSNSGAKIMEGTSEDCLYLNLWESADVASESKLPVMVWIHGGAFVGGSGSEEMFSGEAFARQGVILVTFNYRLGTLGHFAFPALTAQHPEEPKGSYAYMDMIAALRWVHDNIASFGGDPDNVTIFGESAGGVAVHSMLTIPSAEGLFHKAIIESGGGRTGVLSGTPLHPCEGYPVSAEQIGINFARAHGINGTRAEALDSLRALSVEEILLGGNDNGGRGRIPTYSGPIIDGQLVKETFEDAYYNNHYAHVPLIIGSNNAESSGGFIPARTKEELFAIFKENKEEAEKIYNPDGKFDFRQVMTMITTDRVWAEPARFTAKEFTRAGVPAYIYMFSYVPEALKERLPMGAPHASELPYVFNTLQTRWGVKEITETDRETARLMNTYWANFAKSGNPNGKELPTWPIYTLGDIHIIEFRPDGTACPIPEPKKKRLDVVEKSFGREPIK